MKAQDVPDTETDGQAMMEALAIECETIAASHESDAARIKWRQVTIVPEPQLSRLKATHWRIIAKMIRERAGLTAG